MTHKFTPAVMVVFASIALCQQSQQLPSTPNKNQVVHNRSKPTEEQKSSSKPQPESQTSDGSDHPIGGTPSQTKEAHHEAAANTQPYPVKIVSQPSPDGWYIAYVLLTGGAMIIGAGTLIAIWRQTTKIGEQVRHMQRAEAQTDRLIEQSIKQTELTTKGVEAAFLNAKSFIDSQRAHLLTFVVDGSMVRIAGGTHGNTCRVTFKNFGISPGWITEAEGSFQWIKTIEELPPVPQYGVVKFESHGPVLPDTESDSMLITHQISGSPDAASWPHYRLAIFGAIKYRDRFRPDYSLKFCFISNKGNTYFFEQSGPAGYNGET